MSTPRKHHYEYILDHKNPEIGHTRRVIRDNMRGAKKRPYLRITAADPTMHLERRNTWAWSAVYVATPDEATHFGIELAALEHHIMDYDELGRPRGDRRMVHEMSLVNTIT